MSRRPTPPQHLDADARAKWKELVGTLPDQEQGTLDALAAYCSAFSRWTAAETKVQELGPVVKSPQGFPTENPYCRIAAQAQRQMRQWGEALRLTPRSRSTRRKPDDGRDPILSLIGQTAEKETHA